MSAGATAADSICNIYFRLIQSINVDDVAMQRAPLTLPLFAQEDIISLCSECESLFAAEDVCLNLPGSVIVIGDLHGHLLDLLRILQTFGKPGHHRMLFLGDIVDRGEFSLETITLVLALKAKYNDRVHIIRGNHEFDFLCQRCGFEEEVRGVYGPNNTVYKAFLSAFSTMPLLAMICGKFLCVHGGIGPSWFSMRQVSKIERPIHDFGDDFTDAMLWSDPNPHVEFFEPSNRGTGFLFGEVALKEFMDANSIQMVIRAHECVNTGCRFSFDEKLMTLFSASNYCGLVSNNSAALAVDENGNWDVKQFVPLQYLKRKAVKFLKVLNGRMAMPMPARQIAGSKSTAAISQFNLPRLSRLPPLSATTKHAVGPPDVATQRTGRTKWNAAMRASVEPRTPR